MQCNDVGGAPSAANEAARLNNLFYTRRDAAAQSIRHIFAPTQLAPRNVMENVCAADGPLRPTLNQDANGKNKEV